jgi:hypothetical protein
MPGIRSAKRTLRNAMVPTGSRDRFVEGGRLFDVFDYAMYFNRRLTGIQVEHHLYGIRKHADTVVLRGF